MSAINLENQSSYPPSLPPSIKRKREPKTSQIPTIPTGKKKNRQDRHVIVPVPVANDIGCWALLPNEAIFKIFSYLKWIDILQVEQVARLFVPFTSNHWKKQREVERLDFDSAMCSGERETYILNRAVCVFIEKCIPFLRKPKLTKPKKNEIVRILQRLPIECYPHFAALIQTQINNLSDPSALESPEMTKAREFILINAHIHQFGCEALLQGWLEVLKKNTKTDYGFAAHYFTIALEKKATCVAHLALKILPANNLSLQVLQHDVIKHQDYRAMEILVERRDRLTDKVCGKERYPPVLWRLGKNEASQGRSSIAETHFYEAIDGYGTHVPKELLLDTAILQMKMLKFKEGEVLFTRIFHDFERTVTVKELELSFFLKIKLKKWQDAEAIYTQIIKLYGLSDPLLKALICNAAYAKWHLEKWEEADALYEQAFPRVGLNLPGSCSERAVNFSDEDPLVKQKCRIWSNSGCVQCSRYNFTMDWASEFNYATDMAWVKLNLKQFEAAKVLLERVNNLHGDAMPAATLFQLGVVKMKLGKWGEAEDLLKRAIALYGDKVPASILDMLGRVQANLGK